MCRVLAILLACCVITACDSGEPSEGLVARLEREKREEIAKEVERRVRLEQEKMEAERLAQLRSGLKVNLPSGASQDIDPARMSLVIDVPVTGDVVVQGNLIPDDDLDKLFRVAFTRAEDTQVVIRADKGVAHGRVVGIMEKAKAAGLTRLAIATAP